MNEAKSSPGLKVVRLRMNLRDRMLLQIYTDRHNHDDNDDDNNNDLHSNNEIVRRDNYVHYMGFMSIKNVSHLTL